MSKSELDPSARSSKTGGSQIADRIAISIEDFSSPPTLVKKDIPLTREKKEALVKQAYSEGYFRILPEDQQMLLGVRFLNFESDQTVQQEALRQRLWLTTRAGVNYAEKRAIQELDNLRRLIEGEEVEEKWIQKLRNNPRALSYFYSKAKGRKTRELARLLGLRNRDVPGILRAQGISVEGGHPATDLEEVFGNDPIRILELNLRRRSGTEIGKSSGIGASTANRIIRDLGIERPENN